MINWSRGLSRLLIVGFIVWLPVAFWLSGLWEASGAAFHGKLISAADRDERRSHRVLLPCRNVDPAYTYADCVANQMIGADLADREYYSMTYEDAGQATVIFLLLGAGAPLAAFAIARMGVWVARGFIDTRPR